MRRLLIGGLLAATLPLSAQARGFSTEDLGSVPDDPSCIRQAEATFAAFKREVEAGDYQSGSWTAALYRIYGDDFDAIITCNYGPDGNSRATLVVHSGYDTDRVLRKRAAERLKELWKQY